MTTVTPTRMHLPVKKLLTPLVVGASYYRNPLYNRTGATVGLLHEFR